jgi:hypothetical protein
VNGSGFFDFKRGRRSAGRAFREEAVAEILKPKFEFQVGKNLKSDRIPVGTSAPVTAVKLKTIQWA